MWEGIEDGQATKHNFSWLVQGMESNTLLWVADDVYHRKCAPVFSRVGWIIFCQTTGKWLIGSFWEKSPSASSYRAKLLGLCLIHIFALALSKLYKVSSWKAMLCCDNLRALLLSSHDQKRIKQKADCSDLHCSLHSMKNKLVLEFADIKVSYFNQRSRVEETHDSLLGLGSAF